MQSLRKIPLFPSGINLIRSKINILSNESLSETVTSTGSFRSASSSTPPSAGKEAARPEVGDSTVNSQDNSSGSRNTTTTNNNNSSNRAESKQLNASDPNLHPSIQRTLIQVAEFAAHAINRITEKASRVFILRINGGIRSDGFKEHKDNERQPVVSRTSIHLTTHLSGAAAEWVGQSAKLLNDLTGYTGVELMKGRVIEAETKSDDLNSNLRFRKEAYEFQLAKQARNSKELNGLLQRKGSWSENDVSQFASLCKEEHSLEKMVHEAHDAYDVAVSDAEAARTALMAAIRERYTLEQVWSDKVRKASTWWTWVLMALQCVSFLALYSILEPRRAELLKGHVEALLKQQSENQIALMEKNLELQLQQVRDTVKENSEVNVVYIPSNPPDMYSGVGKHQSASGSSETSQDSKASLEHAGQIGDAILSLANAMTQINKDVDLLRQELKYTRYLVEKQSQRLEAALTADDQHGGVLGPDREVDGGGVGALVTRMDGDNTDAHKSSLLNKSQNEGGRSVSLKAIVGTSIASALGGALVLFVILNSTGGGGL